MKTSFRDSTNDHSRGRSYLTLLGKSRSETAWEKLRKKERIKNYIIIYIIYSVYNIIMYIKIFKDYFLTIKPPMLHLILCNIQCFCIVIRDKKFELIFFFSPSVINIQYMSQHIGLIKRIYKNGNTEKYVQTRYFRWHSPSSFISDAIRLVTKKKRDSICSEIEFHLDLRIHYQFAVISQRLYTMIILDDFFAMTKKRIYGIYSFFSLSFFSAKWYAMHSLGNR